MSAPVYSVVLFQYHDLPSETAVTLDPAWVWVLRDMEVFFPGPNVSSLAVVDASTMGTIYSITDTTVPPAGDWFQWKGRQVFNPPAEGPTLLINASAAAGGADIRASGYRLTPS